MSSAAIVYSPVAQMALSSIDEPSLQQLKYHQLLKLASNHNVLKRWSKKEDLIKALLNAKSKKMPKNDPTTSADEWRDGKEVFNIGANTDLKEATKRRTSGRLTFVVDKENLRDSRGTYNLTTASFPGLALQDIDSRLTFNIPKAAAKLVNQQAPIKKSLNKKLTVPISAQSDRRHQPKPAAMKESPLKLSMKSIMIKKKEVRSPMRVVKLNGSDRLDRSVTTHGRKSQAPQTEAKIPDGNAKSYASSRRKSKSDDPSVGRRSIPPATFHSPQAKKTIKESTTTALIVRTKVPNFAAMHQRQFEKMDSLDAYMSKKTERIKKLFGTPTKAHLSKRDNNPFAEGSAQSTLKKNFDAGKRVEVKNTQLRTRTDVKDKTRSHIHGIRTNKRFELQMKFRNL